MKQIFILLIAIYCVESSLDVEYFSKYENFTVYKLIAQNDIQIKALNDLTEKHPQDFNLWTELRGKQRPIDIMVSPKMKNLFHMFLRQFKLDNEIMIDDVGKLIKEHKMSESNPNDDFDYGKYHKLEEIHNWIDSMKNKYPNYVTVLNITNSFEKNQLKAFKISIPSQNKKKALWFDGGIHAREWISPATVIYIGYSLLSKYANGDPDVKEILNTFDFYILPVFNVDGYIYTYTKDRMWRKTRKPTKNLLCRGADPNRNWDAAWCQPGASSSPCSETYCGDSVFSEPEVKGVADFIAKNQDSIISYINFHSYSQLWMSPWGYTTKKPSDFALQDNGSIAAINALYNLYGTKYEHGNIAQAIYVASGNSVDWTYDKAKILYSYAVELRDTGKYGFLLPENQIIPSGQETFEAVKALAFYIKSKM